MQPEAVAEIVFRAALHPRREYWIGLSTLKAILGNMVLPGYLDRYLAKNAFEAQETRVPVAASREDNLMSPVRDLHRTRGSFTAEAANTVFAMPGPLARLLPLLATALAGLSLGLLASRGLAARNSTTPRARTGILR